MSIGFAHRDFVLVIIRAYTEFFVGVISIQSNA